MPTRKENIVRFDLASGTIHRNLAPVLIGEGDISGDTFGVDVFDNGVPASLSGESCVGYFIRSGGDTLVITGTVSGNRAYVQLPASCYIYEGQFTLTIKVSTGSVTSTMRIVDGVVSKVSTDTFVDPGHTIPDVSEYTALVERAEDASDIISGLSTSSQVINGDRYRCIVTKSS